MPNSEGKPKGRPRTVASPEEFDRLVSEYRDLCRENKEPITFTGMALHLGFVSRQALYNYAKYPGFFDSVKRAQTLVEAEYEKRLSGNNPAGAIFALKNHKWSDQRQVDHTGSVLHRLAALPPEQLHRIEDMSDDEIVALIGDGSE